MNVVAIRGAWDGGASALGVGCGCWLDIGFRTNTNDCLDGGVQRGLVFERCMHSCSSWNGCLQRNGCLQPQLVLRVFAVSFHVGARACVYLRASRRILCRLNCNSGRCRVDTATGL
eukprot:8961338-Pyramimonas_sp.AAC.1